MAEMPRPRPPNLHRYKTRHGNYVWCVRLKDRSRTKVRLRAEYGTDAFWAEYEAALKAAPPQQQALSQKGSLSWLWDRYRGSPAWKALKPATRRQRENIMVHVLAKSGTAIASRITRKDIAGGRDDRAETPAQARNFLDCMRGLFRWAADPDVRLLAADPTEGVKNPKRRKTKGFPPWTEDDVTAYQAKWPIGTKERVWLDMILYTGPRRGDVSRMGKQHRQRVFDKEAGAWVTLLSFKTEKGGELIEVTIPILPVLQETLDAGPCGDLTFIVGAHGRPYTKESFGNAFSDAARQAGIQKSAHGVRKIAAQTAADNGATAHQLMAIFGWKTLAMAELYTKEANRRRMARKAMHTLGGRTGDEQSMVLPAPMVRPISGISE